MAFRHGTKAKIYWHTLDFSDYVDEVDPQLEREMAEYAVLSSTWKGNLAGLRSFTMSLSGLYDSVADHSEGQAWALFDGDTARVFAYLPDQDVIGRYAYCGKALDNSEQITTGNDVIKMPVAAVGTNRIYRAEILHPLGAETSTSSEASHDDTAASNYGCEAFLICTALTATDSLDVILEHSDNDVDFTTLASFTQLTAVGSEQVSVAAGAGSVKRYVRVSWTVTDVSGTPSMTFFVAWHRKTS